MMLGVFTLVHSGINTKLQNSVAYMKLDPEINCYYPEIKAQHELCMHRNLDHPMMVLILTHGDIFMHFGSVITALVQKCMAGRVIQCKQLACH